MPVGCIKVYCVLREVEGGQRGEALTLACILTSCNRYHLDTLPKPDPWEKRGQERWRGMETKTRDREREVDKDSVGAESKVEVEECEIWHFLLTHLFWDGAVQQISNMLMGKRPWAVYLPYPPTTEKTHPVCQHLEPHPAYSVIYFTVVIKHFSIQVSVTITVVKIFHPSLPLLSSAPADYTVSH